MTDSLLKDACPLCDVVFLLSLSFRLDYCPAFRHQPSPSDLTLQPPADAARVRRGGQPRLGRGQSWWGRRQVGTPSEVSAERTGDKPSHSQWLHSDHHGMALEGEGGRRQVPAAHRLWCPSVPWGENFIWVTGSSLLLESCWTTWCICVFLLYR